MTHPPPPPPPPSPPPRSDVSSHPPTSAELQAQIQHQLIEAELKVRQWLGSPAGEKAIQVAKVAVPTAGAAVVALWAGASWLKRRRNRRALHHEMAEMMPVSTQGRASLDFLRESLLGLTKPAVARLLGPPLEIHEPTRRWTYPLGRGEEAAAIEVRFNESGEVDDTTFHAREPVRP